ncbi:MAG TPA: hypothetical protein ENJ95_13060 [Bacteroidetes bacterium]|nr:hypothetical protein [Bacteroidota bacterium]
MQNTNLHHHLRRLAPRDFRHLRKFVRSPYFNQRDDVTRLFDHFDKVLNGKKGGSVKKQEVWKAVFPKQPFNDKTLHYTSSFLLKTIKQYLAQSELEQDGLQQQLHLCRALQKRGFEKPFEKEMAAAETLLKKQARRNTRFHYDRYLLEREKAAHTMHQRRSGEMNLQTVHDELTTFFIAETLRQGCTILSHQTMSKQVYDLKLLDEVLALVGQGGYGEVPAVMVYFHAFMALSGAGEEGHFLKLKNWIEGISGQFPQHELRDIYLLAINFCIKKLNAGEKQYIREAFDLYQHGLENKALLENGMLSSYTYKNITRLGMNLGETEWVGRFLEDFKKHLPPRERDNSWRYNLAFFHFQQADYGQAMRLLRFVEFKDVLNNLDARRMLLRSYFELKEFTALDSLLDSFQTYIRRQKDAGYHRQNYLNLVRFIKKLMKADARGKAALIKLKSEIMQTEHVAEKEWLLEKCSP